MKVVTTFIFFVLSLQREKEADMKTTEKTTKKVKPQKSFSQPAKKEKIPFIEYEVEQIDYTGFEVVSGELLGLRKQKRK